MLPKITSTIFILLLLIQFAFSQTDAIILPPNLNTIEWEQPLLGYAVILDTIPLDLSFNQIQKLNFKRFEKDSVFIKDDKCAWLHFNLKNPNPTDTLVFFVAFNSRIHKVSLFSQVNQKIDAIEGGALIDFYKRPYSKNKACFKIILPPQYSSSFWLKFNNFSENRSNLFAELISIKKEEKARLDEAYTDSISHFIEIIYIGFFAILALFTTRMGYIWLDEGYKWYAIYIGSIALFYFRDFENYNNNHVFFFSYFSSWHFKIEATICYVTYISYMKFIQKFLDMKQFYPSLNRLFSHSIKVLIGFLILDLLIHFVWGLAVSFRLFIYVRLMFFAFYFIVIFKIAFGTSTSLSRFIIFGTFGILVPAITSNVSMALGGDSHTFGYGLFWLYEFPTVKIPMFGTRLGILFEAIVFIFGLSWKARREFDELKKMKFNQEFQTNGLNLDLPKYPLTTESGQINIQTRNLIIENIDVFNETIEENKKVEKQPDERVVGAFIHLENEFQKLDFSVKKWAQISFLSASHFSKLISEQTNEAPLTHIQRRRLQHAQQLLSTTNLTIAEIALQSGYDDSNYFSRIFKKTFQLTPSEWQKRYK
jgi:AraC-like DNA-binding protein